MTRAIAGHGAGLMSLALLCTLAPAVGACGGSGTTSGSATAGAKEGVSPSGPERAKLLRSLTIGWVVEAVPKTSNAEPPQSTLRLSQTWETGATDLVTVGVYKGTCSKDNLLQDTHSGNEALLAIRCWHAGEGVQIKVVTYGSNLVFMRAWLDAETEELEFDEFKRIEIPAGIGVDVDVDIDADADADAE